MAYEVLMPQLGLTMEEGTVSSWVKHEGDAVKAGDVLLEITTDKLTNEVTSEHDGVLLKIVAQEGEDIPVKGLLGYVGEAGEVVGDAAPAAPAAAAPAEEAPAAPAVPAPAPVADGKRVRISPLARKTAQKSAPAPAAPAPAAAPATPKAAPTELADGDTAEKISGMRKVVAQRMLQSHTEIPPVTQNTRVDVTELMMFRKMLQSETGNKYSVNDLILKAVAKCLRKHPEMLVSFDGDRIIQRAHVNLGMAVALDAGLIVPVIRDADKMGLDDLSAHAKDLATRAKTNKLTPEDYQGSTFTVSNLGMFGVDSFTPIVNQPNAAILGVCASHDELVMDDEGTITKHQIMQLCLTYDHRLMDGAVAARFGMDLRDILEKPMGIIL